MNKIEGSKQGERASLGMEIEVEPMRNAVRVVIIQHPQEPDKELGTAALCVRSLKNAELKIGLSWPSIRKALGPEESVSDWGILYLGGEGLVIKNEVAVLSKKKEEINPPPPLKGIIVLDGTWSQAKTLWWRNPWFLKLPRIVLRPKTPSRYGRLRKEPRRECLSTIESVALCLRGLGDNPKITEQLNANFLKMLAEYQRRKEAHQPIVSGQVSPSRAASVASNKESKIPDSQTE